VSRRACTLSCAVCGRLCNGTRFGDQTHRFDCCGVVAAHVPVARRGRYGPRLPETVWQRIDNPMAHGYLTGPATSTPRRRRRGVA
jgi:hypothetical protein